MLVYHVIISCYVKCNLLLNEVSELIAWSVVWLLCSGDHCNRRWNYSSVSCLRTDACDTDLSPTATSAGEYTPQTYYLRQRGYVLRGVCLLVCLSVCLLVASCNKKLIRRWDSERELSLRRHCTRTKNTIDSCINCATDRFLQRMFTKFSEITQCNGHYAVQGHSRSPMLVPIESSYTTSY